MRDGRKMGEEERRTRDERESSRRSFKMGM
jgi:hypothetical protein